MTDFNPPPEILTVIEIDPVTGFATVSCRGRLVASYRDEFYDNVRKLIPDSKQIVLDFNDVTHMDSSGLGTVIRLYMTARNEGCEIQLMNLSHGIWKIFSITNVLSLFTVVGESHVRPI